MQMCVPVDVQVADTRPQPPTYEDKSWFWVVLPEGKGLPEGKVPATYLAGTQTWHGFGFGGLRTSELKVLSSLEQKLEVPASVHEALADACSVIGSINRGKSSQVQHKDELCFAQREEWTTWAVDEVLPRVAAARQFTANHVCKDTH